MAAIVLREVSKRFDDVMAVSDLDLDVVDGEFLVLLGPSGCGKSTLLRMIAGLESLTTGTISIAGEDVTKVEPKLRDIAMVFQSYALYPHKTAFENIEYPLKVRRVAKPDRAVAVREASMILDLDAVLDRKPGQMSGGQRQRVALARAIVRRPKVFLMDEPLSNLDAKLRVQTRGELIALHERLATTFVYVTHDQVEAMTMGDRVAVMLDGRLQQVGAPQQVYDRPANVFVAQFIGSPAMNVLEGAAAGALSHGNAPIVGIRPEHLTLVADGPLVARLDLVESLGHERHLRCVTEEGSVVILRVPADQPVPMPGHQVSLAAIGPLHRFDPVTKQRVDA